MRLTGMRDRILLLLLVAGMLLVSCQAVPGESSTPTNTTQSELSTPPVPTRVPAPVNPRATQVAVTPAASRTPAPTFTSWETVQQSLKRLQGALERSSDGYAGLAVALEQPAANDTWCANLEAAINDFIYLGDQARSDQLKEIRTSQGCP
jgi:hypothetical protein